MSEIIKFENTIIPVDKEDKSTKAWFCIDDMTNSFEIDIKGKPIFKVGNTDGIMVDE